MIHSLRHLCRLLLCVLMMAASLTTGRAQPQSATRPSLPQKAVPKLSGYHFKITIPQYEGYCDIVEHSNGELTYSGYTVDILKELSIRANFTYELRTPSGFGSLCEARLDPLQQDHPDAYHARYRQAYQCGETDVNDRPLSHYSTDMYWGGYYITPDRLLQNKFTVPIAPPAELATFGMMGTATHIAHISDLETTEYKVCSFTGTAVFDTLVLGFPNLDIQGIQYGEEHDRMNDGTCDVIIDGMPFLQQTILHLYKQGKCTGSDNKPIGVIGKPLDYGLGHLSFGLRDDLPPNVLETFDYWLQALMACFPEDENGYCPNGIGSISRMYVDRGGRGDECGYVQYPQGPPAKGLALPVWAIVAICITPVVLVIAFGMLLHGRQLKRQEQRMKKRFIQQLARNIDIGPSANQISAAKLSETFQHIAGQQQQQEDNNKGKDGALISKADLSKWMNDLNLDFLSESDFDRLWHAMDLHNSGYVDPLEFYTFLSECQKQFAEVHEEYQALPKSEKRKLASRRLSNIKLLGGQEEVEKLERRNNRRSRMAPITPTSHPSKEMSQAIEEASRSLTKTALMDGSMSCSRSNRSHPSDRK